MVLSLKAKHALPVRQLSGIGNRAMGRVGGRKRSMSSNVEGIWSNGYATVD